MSGYRPCLVCKPLEKLLDWPSPIKELLQQLTEDPFKKVKDADLRAKGIEPSRLRRWFLKQHGITFQAYQRMLRLWAAAKQIKKGETVTSAAFNAGFDSLSGFSDAFKNTFGVSPKNGRRHRIVTLKKIETPLGWMVACAIEEGICLLEFADGKHLEMEALAQQFKATVIQCDSPYFEQLDRELKEYFRGTRQIFELPLVTPGTDFQNEVWAALCQIPYGQTRSYKQQAAAMNKPESIRAIASANGRNRIAILIPCHRVIGTDGTLTGYAGGLWRKKYLLELEQKALNGTL